MSKIVLLSISLLLSLSGYAFDFLAGGLRYSTNNGGTSVTVIRQDTSIKKAVIPDKVEYEGRTYKVTSIGEQAFYECRNLTSVTIPEGVNSIGVNAFQECENLISVIIPNSITSIGGKAFSGCKSLTSVAIPEGVISIGVGCFETCESLTTMEIPKSLISIGKWAFSGCGSLTRFSVKEDHPIFSESEGVLYNKNKDTLLFYPNAKAKNYIIPSNVISIQEYAFSRCWNLTSVTVPSSVTHIGQNAFEDCGNLKRVNCQGATPPYIDKSFPYLPGCIFYVPKNAGKAYSAADGWRGTELTHVNILEEGTITEYKIDLQEAGTFLNSIRNDYQKVYKLSISGPINGTDIKTINRLPILRILDLENATIVSGGENYTTKDNEIGPSMFSGEEYLESITLPKSIRKIGYSAFWDCMDLRAIYVWNDTPPIMIADGFQGVSKDSCVLYVPKGSEAAYKKADFWKEFRRIMSK